MPSRSSFLLAFDRQERGEEEELENWVFLSLFPELQPGQGAHRQPLPMCLPSALGTARLTEPGKEMPSEASAMFSEGQLNSHLCGSAPRGIYPMKHTHTQRTLEGRSGRDLNHIRLKTCPFQKQLAQTDLVPITAPQLALIRVGPASAQAQGTSWLSATPQGGAHIGKQCKHSPSPFGLQFEGPGPPEWRACHSLCRDTKSPSPVS